MGTLYHQTKLTNITRVFEFRNYLKQHRNEVTQKHIIQHVQLNHFKWAQLTKTNS